MAGIDPHLLPESSRCGRYFNLGARTLPEDQGVHEQPLDIRRE